MTQNGQSIRIVLGSKSRTLAVGGGLSRMFPKSIYAAVSYPTGPALDGKGGMRYQLQRYILQAQYETVVQLSNTRKDAFIQGLLEFHRLS